MARYETRGLDDILAHYNREESVDGQWYVFIIDENDLVIAHPTPTPLSCPQTRHEIELTK